MLVSVKGDAFIEDVGFNRTHSRTGTLWKERFKSVMVESGVAARDLRVGPG